MCLYRLSFVGIHALALWKPLTDVCVVKTEILLDMVSSGDISPPPPPPPPPPIELCKDNTSTSASDLEPVRSTVDIRSAALALASELAMAQAEQEAEAAVISSAAVSVATLAAEKSARSMVEAVAMGIRMRLQTLSPTLVFTFITNFIILAQ